MSLLQKLPNEEGSERKEMRIRPGEGYPLFTPPHAGFVLPSQTMMTRVLAYQLGLPCSLEIAFNCIPFFVSLFKTLSRYILADSCEIVGSMRDFAEGLPYDVL